jgi:2-hydroxychromene-2-carboxylate isomerase
MEKQIDFYFDLVSPYSYIASMLIDDVAHRVNAKVSWKPFLLGGVFKAVGTTDPPGLHPIKKPYLLKDLQRLSKHLKIPIKMPPDFPVRTVLAMRTLCGFNADEIPQAANTLYKAYWVNNKDIADPDVVGSLVGREAVERAGMQEIKDALFQSTEEAVRLGAFGAPTFFVKDEMFFGHDRLPLLELHLNGQM